MYTDKTPICPTCKASRRSRWNGSGTVHPNGSRKWKRLYRKGKIKAHQNGCGVGTVLDSSLRYSIGPKRWINKSSAKCLDEFHNTPLPACPYNCPVYDIKHWHEDGPNRAKCDEICFDATYDSFKAAEDPYYAKYHSPEGDDRPHWHHHLDLPRLHDPEKTKAKKLYKRQKQSKRNK